MDIALLWNIWNGAELLPVILFSKHVTVDVDDNGSFSCYMQSMFGQKKTSAYRNSLSDQRDETPCPSETVFFVNSKLFLPLN